MLIFQYNVHVFYYEENFMVITCTTGLFQTLLSKVTILPIIFFDAVVILSRE